VLAIAIVPDPVMLPPLRPVPAVMDVTVPPLPAPVEEITPSRLTERPDPTMMGPKGP
jgi:hypothetical protein